MNINEIKKDFPIFNRKMNGKELIYLDSAATSQKPLQVINAFKDFYENYNSNIHRGIYTLSEEATNLYELTREKVAKFINASSEEIIFTKNTTEAINAIVFTYFNELLNKEDIILLTEMEHHSNIVPWQLLSKKINCKIDYLTVNDGEISLKELEEKAKFGKIKVLAITHVSNVLGTINPIKDIAKICKHYGIKLLVDGAQAVPHIKVDVKDLDCDFYCFSAHKMLGPTGVGVLYAKKELLNDLKPFISGGGTILEVTKQDTKFKDNVEKFEAGTQNIADVVVFSQALDYLQEIGMENIRKHELELTKYALEELSKIPGIEIYGNLNAEKRAGVIAFNIKGIHAHDLATILDEHGIAIRASHHCCMILHKKLGIDASARISFYIYNTKEDVYKLVNAIFKAKEVFGK
ncbi:MAG: SufS family cysteine desulfurase [Nanoarchaeota archaeon]